VRVIELFFEGMDVMHIVVKRFALVPLLVLAAACPGDKKNNTAQIPVDTAKPDTTRVAAATPAETASTDLSKIPANLPKAAPDTFHQQKLKAANVGRAEASASYPEAPTPLMDAVEREQSATRFCYTEFGQKADPSLRGNVAMVVTVGNNGITDARVGDAKWTGSAGSAVNRCLNQKAKQAWNLAPGAVKPGHYVVQLGFTGAR
jgi:hypothetical protein